MSDPLVIADRTFKSRLIVGTGKYPSHPIMADAHRAAGAEMVTVAIDIVDEAHSLRLAMRRLAGDADLRARLGAAALDFWMREHSPERMLEDYQRVIRLALATPAPRANADWPAHLRDEATGTLQALLRPFPGLDSARTLGTGVQF